MRVGGGTQGPSRVQSLDMKVPSLTLTLAAALAALGSGCASSSPAPAPVVASRYPDSYPAGNPRDPNQTARGAVAGAVAGAVIGGIIGNNSDHGNTEKGAAIGAVAGGLAGAAVGHRADQREAASADTAYSVRSVPPVPGSEPYETAPSQPSRNAVWIRGHYVYVGSGYQWQPGRWEIPPAGARSYFLPSWQQAANGGYVYVRGQWQ